MFEILNMICDISACCSGATVEGPKFDKSDQFKLESKHLFPVLAEARVVGPLTCTGHSNCVCHCLLR